MAADPIRGKKWTEIRFAKNTTTGQSALELAFARIHAQQPPLQAGEIVVIQKTVDEVFLLLFI
jgi:hypothetical protein